MTDRFVEHSYPERRVDLGEVVLNYVEAGSADKSALVLVPEQTGSWWSYEAAIGLLAEDFHVFAVDLRGQGRSTWTPKRYSLDNFGNDLVRFLALVVRRPAVVAGNSSGAVLAAWLAAYAMPGQIRGVFCEDPPFFSSEYAPACGHSIREGAGPLFELYRDYLGDQWSVGDWAGLIAAAKASPAAMLNTIPLPPETPQNIKEYDPEWARAFVEGTVALHTPHDRMLAQVKAPVLLTHHWRRTDPETGAELGALSDVQAETAQSLMHGAGVQVDYVSLPDAVHVLHAADPAQYAGILTDWAAKMPVR